MTPPARIRDCKDVVSLLTEYLEGSLAAGDVATLEKHLALCSACGEYLESIRKTRDAMRRLASRDVPEECRRELRALLDAARRGAAARPGRPSGGRARSKRTTALPRPARRRS